jgi:hypothetical protein
MHHTKTTSAEDDGKPEIIIHYNETKSGVDNLDHLVGIYPCKRGTRRWPLCLFMNMLDVAAVAAYVVWMAQMQEWNHNYSNKRHQFLTELSNKLVLPEQMRRFENPRAMQGVKKALEFLRFKSTPLVPAPSVSAQGRSHVCPRNIDRKVKTRCIACNAVLHALHRVLTFKSFKTKSFNFRVLTAPAALITRKSYARNVDRSRYYTE